MNTAHLDLHHAVLQHVPGADETLCATLIVPLHKAVSRAYADAAGRYPTLVDDAVHLALMNYMRAPQHYDPTQSNLLTYLTTIGHRKFLTLVAGEQKRRSREVFFGDMRHDDGETVSDVDFAGNENIEEAVIAQMGNATVQRALTRHFPDPQERQVLTLLLERVRTAEPYAAILGIGHLPPAVLQKSVNQYKNKLRMRLRRKLDQILPDYTEDAR